MNYSDFLHTKIQSVRSFGAGGLSMIPKLTHLSLFSGIGGLDLAAEQSGFRTVGQCEWADYPRAVLEKHWSGLPRWRDIRTLTGDDFYEKTGLRTVTVLSGGFPCQPFSTAGKRRGKEDDRYLWPEMLRVIQEIRPAWVVGENVAGIVNMTLDTVLSDLESIGYTCQPFIIPACAVDAPHRRDRCAILAHSNSKGQQMCQQHGTPDTGWEKEPHGSAGQCCEAVANAQRNGLRQNSHQSHSHIEWDDKAPKQGGGAELRTVGCCGCDVPNADGTVWPVPLQTRRGWTGFVHIGWWPAEPSVGRVAHGIPARVDRLKCLGNAVVPQQFYPIFRVIAELEGNA